MNPKTEIKRKWAATECIIIDPHQIIRMVQYPHIIAESNLKQSETQIFFLYIWFWRFESFDETEKKTIAWDIWSHLYLNFIATHIYTYLLSICIFYFHYNTLNDVCHTILVLKVRLGMVSMNMKGVQLFLKSLLQKAARLIQNTVITASFLLLQIVNVNWIYAW